MVGGVHHCFVDFDQETDLSFKVSGILDQIGPVVSTDWEEATPVKAGTMLAELKQAQKEERKK